MKFELWCAGHSHLPDDSGTAEYSYRFVRRSFAPLFEQFGKVRLVDATEPDVTPDPDAIVVFFGPPHRLPPHLDGRAIPVIAWEFDTIPFESWLGDDRQNWASVLASAPAVICLSESASAAVRRAVEDTHVITVPTPVWETHSQIGRNPGPHRNLVVSADVRIIANGVTCSPKRHDENRVHVDLDGVVFTSVFNPIDGRKQWRDLVSAFIAALGGHESANLLLKLVHHDPNLGAIPVIRAIEELPPHRARIIVVDGRLPDSEMASLISSSDFITSSSRGEGQCLPLLEFMSAGIPAITPRHTAMADYVTTLNAVVVEHTSLPASWPQDPRQVIRCSTFPVVWESMRDGYTAAYELSTSNAKAYEAMSAEARRSMEHYCSAKTVSAQIRDLLHRLH